MARIEITNARVARIIQGRGFEAVETYQTRSGEPRETKFTIWSDSPQDIPVEGVTVNISGNVSVRLEEFENREGEQIRFARMHVNQPKVSLQDTPPQPVQQAPDSWSQGFASEAPF